MEAMEAMEAMSPSAGEATKPAGDETLTFTRKYPEVGTVRTNKDTMSMDLTIEAGGKSMKMENSGNEESKEEVLAVDKNIVTKLKVTWIAKTDVQKADGKEQVEKSPIVGKTFILEMKDGKAVALDEAGKPLDDKLAQSVLKEHGSFGKPMALIDALPTTPIKVGDKVDGLAEAMKKDIEADMDADKGEKTTLEGVTFTLKEIKTEGEQKLGVFDVTVTFKMAMGEGMNMSMALKGTMTLRAQDGWPTVMSLEGPISAMGKDNVGKMVMTKSVSYGK
jgi:hypothetical protein